MGSKRAMLTNGLGHTLTREAVECDRVVDLFCGSGSVAWYAATTCQRPVLAVDLQQYAVCLASAVVERRRRLDPKRLGAQWLRTARAQCESSKAWEEAVRSYAGGRVTRAVVAGARGLCADSRHHGPVWTPYGGHYFSPVQALRLDALLASLPDERQERAACLAATIMAASQCAASPGHTAQPFQPTRGAARFIREAWERDPFDHALSALGEISAMSAGRVGKCRVGDALAVARRVRPTDLVFVDPPYSEVHYSRFYHVLETIAKGHCGPVSGSGRYPPVEERPFSVFSRRSQSRAGLAILLETLAKRGCTVILTFPAGEASNGLSGDAVRAMAEERFRVDASEVETSFSTLGGNGRDRSARRRAGELILTLRPR